MEDKRERNIEMQVVHFSREFPEITYEIRRNQQHYDFGKNNDAPAYFESLLTKSTTHATLVERIAAMIAGEGFEIKSSAQFKNENSKHDLDEILMKIALDTKIYGAFALNIKWSRDQRYVASIDYVDVATVRKAIAGVGRNAELDYFWISPDWSAIRKEGNTPKLYQGFSRDYRKDGNQIMYVKMEGRNNDLYGIPSSMSAHRYMELQSKIIDYHNNNIDHGSSIKTVIKIDGAAPSQEEKEAFQRMWKQFRGANGAKSAIIWDAEGIHFEPLDEGFSDDRFQSLDCLTTQRIKESHSVTGKGYVFGLADNNSGTNFSSNKDQINEFVLFHNLVVRPFQIKIEKVFSKIFDQEFNIIPLKLSEESPDDTDGDNLLPSVE